MPEFEPPKVYKLPPNIKRPDQRQPNYPPGGPRPAHPQSEQIRNQQQVSGRKPGGNLSYWIENPPPGYRVAPGAGTYPAVNRAPFESYPRRPPQQEPFISSDQMINNMPNSELLTPSERWLYNTLPRVMNTQIFGKSAGDRLEGFNEGWAGKALNALDFAAEGLERSFGFLSQWSDANLYGTEQDREEFNQQLGEAWYAGGLWSDMTNLPGFKYDENGQVTGLTIPGQLPGRAGIVNARRRIAELTAQGVDYGDALKQVRTEYYNDLGALSIRAQMQDTYQHILLDPLNVLTAYIKPVELAQARRYAAITGKIDNLDDLVKLAADTAQAAEDFKAAGKVTEAAAAVEDAALITARVEALKNTPLINNLDRLAIWMTGGDPLDVPTTTLGKLGRSKLNPFSLTDDARAYEMMTTVQDNIGTYILSKAKEPDQIMDMLYRVERGALGPEFGHAFLTKEGRVSQSVIAAARIKADALYSKWAATAAERVQIDDIVRLTGASHVDVVKAIENGDVAQIVQRLTDVGEEGVRIADGITDDFTQMVSTFTKSEIPYTVDMFKHLLVNEIGDATAQLAIARFGLKEKGLIMKMSHALKSAETLAFLRVNPTFVAKNFFNNEMTNIARGGGLLPAMSEQAFIDLVGFTPPRFGQAFTAAGEQFGVKLGKGEQAIADVLRGEKGMLTKLDNMFQKAGDKLGPLDMGTYASKMEASASKRAFMYGYMQGWNRYFWKPGKGYKTMAQSLPADVMEGMPAEFVRALERNIQGVMNEEQLRTVASLDNMNRTVAGIADDIIKEKGYHIGDRFGDDFVKELTTSLDDAMQRGGPAEVRRVIEDYRTKASDIMEELAQSSRQNRIDEMAAITELTGPNGFLKVFAEAIDEKYGYQLAYDIRMSKIDPTGLTGEAANVWWNRFTRDNAAAWGRSNDRWDDFIKGAERGIANIKDAKGKPMKLPTQVKSGYTTIRKTWDDFFKTRTKLHKQYFDAMAAGKQPKIGWPEIQQTLWDEYAKAAVVEKDLIASIDDAVVGMVKKSDPEVAKSYAAYLKQAREVRAARRQNLAEFRTSIEGLSPRGKADAWKQYHVDVQEKFDIPIWKNERSGAGILEGQPVPNGAYNQLDDLTGASAETDIRTLANRYNIPTATESGVPFDERIRHIVNKYMRGGYDETTKVAEEVAQAAQRPVSTWTRDEYLEAVEAAIKTDDEILVELFGESGARTYKQAQATSNTPYANLTRQSLADETIDAMEESLTEAQRNRLFGIGEPGLGPDDLDAYKGAFDDLSDATDEILYAELQRNITKVAPGDIKRILTGEVDDTTKEIAFMKSRNAINELGQRGAEPNEIMATVFRNISDELEPNDAELLMREWIDAAKRGPGAEEVAEAAIPAVGTAEELTTILDDLAGPVDPADINVGNKVTVMVREGRGEVVSRLKDSPNGSPRWRIKWDDGSSSIHQGVSVTRVPDEEIVPVVQGWARPEDAIQYNDIARISPDLAEEAFEARRVFRGEPEIPPLPEVEPQDFPTLANADKVINDYRATIPPTDVSTDQHWFANGYAGLDDIEDEALKRLREPVVSGNNLTPQQQAEVSKYLRQVEGQMADAKLAATKYGEFKRDAALLNYNRRYNYNNWLSTIFPFEFWTTQSLAKWALHSIDRPAMLTTYLRMKKLIETAGMKENGFPSRLKGSFRVNLPFVPDWMGDQFIDPIRTLLPFDNWASIFENYAKEQQGIDGRAERLLLGMVEQGQISSEQADQALADRAGPVWDQALAQAKQNDGEGMSDAWDYANMLLSPHAPLMWAREAAQGTPENIGPLMPLSRTMKQAFGVLGIDTAQAKWNVAGNIRKGLGLPAFDQWDDYRVDRELSNMAAEGYNLTDIKLAMIQRSGPLWDEASSRAAKMYAGGGAVPFLLKTLGIPTQSYPVGEQHQRALQQEFSDAYQAYDNGDVTALSRFFDDYPEYEARLALWDEPEERLRNFQVDNIWSQYHEMPSLHKRQLREALGDEFQQNFLDKETRNYEAISNETLQMWAKMMGSDPVGSLNSDTQPIEFADSDEAWRVEQFYELRGSLYPRYKALQDQYFDTPQGPRADLMDANPEIGEYFDMSKSERSAYRKENPAISGLLDQYFDLPESPRKGFLDQNPELRAYWDWRRDFFHRNPTIVPYLDDNFEFDKQPTISQAQTQVPAYTFQEWTYVLGSVSTARVLSTGDIPQLAQPYLEDIADQLGISIEEMADLVSQSQR